MENSIQCGINYPPNSIATRFVFSCRTILSLLPFHITGDRLATHLTLISPSRNCVASTVNVRPNVVTINPWVCIVSGYLINIDGSCTCNKENIRINISYVFIMSQCTHISNTY